MSTDGQTSTSEMNQLNRLYKSEAAILNTYWKATEILGQEVEGDQYPKTPYLLIKKNSFSATGGCNSMFGTFSLSEKGKRIQFSDLAVSEMICQKEHLDQELIEVLNRSQQYIIRNGELQLIVGKAAPLARFKSVMH
jgi:heat shock protein HslJ